MTTKKRSIDIRTQVKMAGWILPNADGSPTVLRLTMNDQDLGLITANRHRRDLYKVIDGGRAGFEVKLARGDNRFLRALPKTAHFKLTDIETEDLVCDVTVEGQGERERFTNEAGEDYVFYQKDGGFTVPLSARRDDWWTATLAALGETFKAAAANDTEVQIGYGTLLGHVRENGFIPHDDDLDVIVHCGEQPTALAASVAFMSRMEAMFGAKRVAFDTNGQAHVGFEKGRSVSLDFFASWTHEGRYYQNFTIAGGVAADDVFPLQATSFMGVDVRMARKPHAVLEAIYGPSWSTPDPSFKWNRPQSVTDYFTPIHNYARQANKDYWEGYYGAQADKAAAYPDPPSQFAAFATDFLNRDDALYEFGCGNGRDSLFFGAHGYDILACDYSEAAVKANAAKAASMGRSNVQFAVCNVADARSIERFLARDGDDRRAVFYSRFFLHAISDAADQTMRATIDAHAKAGDLVVMETRVAQDADRAKVTPDHFRRFPESADIIAAWQALGWTKDYTIEGTGFAKYKQDDAYVLRFVMRKS